MTVDGIEDQNNDNNIDEPQDILEEHVNNDNKSQNNGIFLQFCS